ncbi:hypothetical protein BCY91_15455 [Pelobium manganitolerans]|uniref:Uncharacterized protein n=1 Tax=Pelobium manganitolerans TaxID=1842495 RepID=A0A419S973_9SPHI|nr:hypothetical protein [Pelobium manganitolerans]RKD18341.1 hypothetical protein BCY91_15455 [Pelobium manganitolerans]
MTKKLPNKKQLDTARQQNVWDFGNAILYKLCKDNFEHKTDDHILTKVLFIGRIYAAAVERRKNKSTDINDNFYTETIAPTFRKSKLDEKLSYLKTLKTDKVENIKSVLQTHFYLTSTLQKITALEKRSFSSKYLHFHLPDLFYIYDSRAVTALRQFTSNIPEDLKHILELDNIDSEYTKFYCKCYDFKRRINTELNIDLTNRQLDNLLIEVANKQSSLKLKKL